MNGAAASILGTESNRAIGRQFVIVARDADLNGLLSVSFQSNTPKTATINYGRTGAVLEAVAQVVDRMRERLGIVVIRDVTELKHLESVRREFVANVSHELRTPLASIRAVVETLEAGAIDDPEVAGDFLRSVVDEVTSLTGLIDELLDLARLESGRIVLKTEPLEPSMLISSGVERLRPQAERAQLSLTSAIDPSLPHVLADRARIEQVLLNLVHNAIKFTNPGGAIQITAEVEGPFVAVSVADTGVGIEQEELPHVFERFYKSDKARRSEGTGLGLAITKHIVQSHGGSIWVNSEPGHGATFTFTLSRADLAETESPGVEAEIAV
jgi:two-component system, OmpR family, phosphate regulon sensor histidine kinase PhoR